MHLNLESQMALFVTRVVDWPNALYGQIALVSIRTSL